MVFGLWFVVYGLWFMVYGLGADLAAPRDEVVVPLPGRPGEERVHGAQRGGERVAERRQHRGAATLARELRGRRATEVLLLRVALKARVSLLELPEASQPSKIRSSVAMLELRLPKAAPPRVQQARTSIFSDAGAQKARVVPLKFCCCAFPWP